jgi:hypothetical protein
MKGLLLAATTGSWILVTPALAQSPTEGKAPGSQRPASPTTLTSTAQLITASAKVVKVDSDKHELTLKDDQNKPFTINVPEDVNRLENVKPGDRLEVTFYESVAVSLKKPGAATPGQESSTTVGREPGALPGNAVVQRVTTTAKITQITPSNDELTIEAPGGKPNTIRVEDPAVRSQLSHLKVGDKVQTTYTQAMATRIRPARAM